MKRPPLQEPTATWPGVRTALMLEVARADVAVLG